MPSYCCVGDSSPSGSSGNWSALGGGWCSNGPRPSAVFSRIQKVLDSANIKLSSVATDEVGVSGRVMLEGLAQVTEDLDALAGWAKGALRKKHDALEGRIGAHHRFMLRSQLRVLDNLSAEIVARDQDVAQRTRSFEESVERLDGIPEVGRHTAEEVLVEIGTDMSRFPTAMHLSSWAKVCPRNSQSAGKRRSGPTGRGNP